MMCLSRAAASAAFSAWNRSSGVLKRTSSRTTVPVIARSAAPCRGGDVLLLPDLGQGQDRHRAMLGLRALIPA